MFNCTCFVSPSLAIILRDRFAGWSSAQIRAVLPVHLAFVQSRSIQQRPSRDAVRFGDTDARDGGAVRIDLVEDFECACR